MVHIPGAKNHTSDALSRHPAGITNPPRLDLPDDNTTPDMACPHHKPTLRIPTTLLAGLSTADPTEDDDEGLASAICAAIAGTPLDWESLQVATAADTTLQELATVIENGPPNARHHLPPSIRDWFPYIHNLSTIDGVICRGERIVVPTELRPACLSALHAAHQGVSGMTARAETSLFWPGITRDIADTRNRCAICNGNAPSQPAMPSITPVEPEYPFQHLCADFFHHEGVTYLVLVDRFSNWPIVSPSKDGASGLLQSLRDTFATFGIPDTLTSDGGPEFSSHATREFLKTWGVHHRISSALPPRQLSGRSSCEDNEAAHCREHRTGRNPIRPIPQSPPAISEWTGPHNEGITGDMPLWKGNPRSPTGHPRPLQAPPGMGRQDGP